MIFYNILTLCWILWFTYKYSKRLATFQSRTVNKMQKYFLIVWYCALCMSKFIGTSKDTKSSRFLDDMMDDVNKLLNEKNVQEIDVLLTYVIVNVKQNVVCQGVWSSCFSKLSIMIIHLIAVYYSSMHLYQWYQKLFNFTQYDQSLFTTSI